MEDIKELPDRQICVCNMKAKKDLKNNSGKLPYEKGKTYRVLYHPESIGIMLYKYSHSSGSSPNSYRLYKDKSHIENDFDVEEIQRYLMVK